MKVPAIPMLDWQRIRLAQEVNKPEPACAPSEWEVDLVTGGLRVFFPELSRRDALVGYWYCGTVEQSRESVEELRGAPEQLQRENAELWRENERLRRENEQLRAQFTLLSAKVQASSPRIRESAISDPYTHWLERHRDELAKYPDYFLAVDVEGDKIVESSRDRAELNRKLSELFKRDEGARSRLLIIDTSLYF